MSERMFPVMSNFRRSAPNMIAWVPWSLVAPHEAQARTNHMQSLDRLAERGGLAPCELMAVLEDRRWHRMDEAEAVKQIRAALDATAPRADSGGEGADRE